VTARLQFRRLLLTSPARNYEVHFHNGVNVIAGPTFTGKSSILELLDYACGAKTAPGYPELGKCSDVLVEMVVSGETISVRRGLRDATGRAFLYEGSIDNILNGRVDGVELLARHDAVRRSVSLDILERLGLGAYKVKTARTKTASETSSFSLRDMLMLLYIDQDRMGSKVSFFEDDHFKANKWRAAFEIVHELFDAGLAGMADSLVVEERKEQELLRYLENARKFLDQFKVPALDELDRRAAKLEQEIVRVRAGVKAQRSGERARLGHNHQLAEQRNQLADEERGLAERGDELRRNAKQLGRLRVQYERELAQWKFLSESHAIMGSLPVSRCPACFQDVALMHDAEHCHVCKQGLQKETAEVPVEIRVKTAARRIHELDAHLGELSEAAGKLDARRTEVHAAVEELDQTLRRVRESSVLPETRAIIEGNEVVARLENEQKSLREQIEYRKRAQGDGSSLAAVNQRVRELRERQRLAMENKRSPEAVVKDLSAWYQALLSDIHFPELRDAFVDATSYRPFVRAQPYPALSSRGAISLAVAAWHLALLEQALMPDSRSLFPRLLMLDSPLSHVGRAADDPEFRDQKLVDGFYAVLTRLNKRAADFQIFVCDNRPPAAAREMVSVEFTGNPAVEGRYGLIDDEHPLAMHEVPE
jgi:AAA domain